MQKRFYKLIRAGGLFFSIMFLFQTQGIPFEAKEGHATLALILRLPKNYEFVQGGPASLEWQVDSPETVQITKAFSKDFNPFDFPYKLSLNTKTGKAIITFKAQLSFCNKPSRMCFQDTFQTKIPLEITPRGSSTVLYTWDIKPKKRVVNTLIPLRR